MSVVKSNELIQKAAHDLNSIQLKFWYKVVDLIDSKSNEFKQFYIVDLEDFILNDLKYENLSNLTNIKKDIENISDKGFHIITQRNDNDTSDLYTRWFSTIETTLNNKKIKVEIPKAMSKYYLDINSQYTLLNAKIVYKLKSRYSIRIYELISSYKHYDKKNKNYIEFHISYIKLKELLGLSNKYKDYRDFKLRVLETAKKELKEKKTDIYFDYRASGRGPGKDIIFYIYKRDDQTNEKAKAYKEALPETYNDLERELKQAGINGKIAKQLITEYDPIRIRKNLEYAYQRQKESPKKNFAGYVIKLIKEDFAGKTFEQRQEYKREREAQKQKQNGKPIPIKEQDNIERLKNNPEQYQNFLKFLALMAQSNPNGRAAAALPELMLDVEKLETIPFIDALVDKFFGIFKE